MVDTLDETNSGPNGETWIEITDSQLKFESSGKDEYQPDSERVTFEVHSYSRSLVQANLNFQLMPILADRGVPFKVFSDLLEADLTARAAELEAAMESGLAIRKWNQDVNTISTTERALYGVEMCGGLPDALPEKINWFVEVGLNCLCVPIVTYKLNFLAWIRAKGLLPPEGFPIQSHFGLLPSIGESNEHWSGQIHLRIHGCRSSCYPRGG